LGTNRCSTGRLTWFQAKEEYLPAGAIDSIVSGGVVCPTSAEREAELTDGCSTPYQGMGFTGGSLRIA
jgi:hypothetical protein